jgi:hypothetical protein
MVVDDRLEVALQLFEHALAPMVLGAAHAHDQQQRRSFAGAVIAQLDLSYVR